MNAESDMEALKPGAGRRSGSLKKWLGVTVAVFFVILIGVTVTVTLMVMEIQRELAGINITHPHHYSKVHYSPSILRPESPLLKNSTMMWELHSGRSGVTYNEINGQIQVKHKGTYLMYLNLGVHCTPGSGPCSGATLVIRIKDQTKTKLTCVVMLPPGAETVSANECLSVVPLRPQDPLMAVMTVTGESEDCWKLTPEDSRFGLLPVDEAAK